MRRGHLIVEIVVALALISVVFLTLLELYPSSFLAQAESKRRIQASNLAESLLDACQATPLSALLPKGLARQTYTPATLGSLLPTYPLGQELKVAESSDGTKLQPQVEVERMRQDPGGNTVLVQLTVTVSWQRGQVKAEVKRQQLLADLTR